LAEFITCLQKAKRRVYIKNDEFDEHYDFAFNLMNRMVVFNGKYNELEVGRPKKNDKSKEFDILSKN